ncbi:hypothetical protein COI41_14360 [Bacillus toyonensis]|uniref:hypothetical protein n=1 Tax=Bacillus toyonensis TaxID=155322 RepID=UPI000BEF25EF|nr:hypothetical protein [Bacillus toyonensis]PEO62725.1 hypothetical protein CN567_19790 [Bacillus toyonensis]PFX78117.1 hypothetical protein COL37_25065 [Bacillus toyonensis]PFX79167.1 hypothetical protein COL38_19945 [Bacillus toyonensis]PGB18392.1 hypothetical protein COL98_14135 [Bacillus toyonensis]PHF54144.1 hypothetical protein COI41_14360 [Bacillus toyonensis]
MKRYLVLGLLLSSLLVGCGQENASTKKETPKSEQEVKKVAQADKKVDDTKRDELKDAEKLDDNVPRDNENKAIDMEKNEDKFDIVQYQLPLDESSSTMPVDYFEALEHGMPYEEVAKALHRNATSAIKTKKFDTELIEYTYEAPDAMIQVQFKDGNLFGAEYVGQDKEMYSVIPVGWDVKNNRWEEEKNVGVRSSESKSNNHTSQRNEGKNVEADDRPASSTAGVKVNKKPEEATINDKPNSKVEQNHNKERQCKEVEEFKPSDADMERIKRQEDRWNTPSGGVGATWQQEMEEMKKQK